MQRLVAPLVLLAVFLPASVAEALSVTVPAGDVGMLKANSTTTSAPSSITVTSLPLESWFLHVGVLGSGQTAGHMTRDSNASPCDEGVAALGSPLHLSFTAGLPSTTVVRPDYDLASANNPVVVQGKGPDTVQVTYSQDVGSEAIRAGCSYSVVVQYTVGAS